MKKIRAYLHLIDKAAGYEWTADEIVDSIISSGLIDRLDKLNIYCQYSFNPKNFAWLREKLAKYPCVKFHAGKGFPEDFEIPTIMEIKKDADSSQEDYYVLYMHHKGVTKTHVEAENDFRKFLLYGTVTKWEEHVNALDFGYDISGLQWWGGSCYYVGNFWWARTEYIRKLPDLQLPSVIGKKKQIMERGHGDDWYRADAEYWIGMKDPRLYDQSYLWPKRPYNFGWDLIKPEEYMDK